eukprot:CAMPEP_0197848284 /NCGR_PEP_ID=MMETSP1438-20131217/8138_1 /TAXON_ID=1461541 /ORGANISM="Pterosperma sp., Strain CCMP1384" /LENGTH=353 /DNA_ID=CAMNT_0043460445 /DNA_START=61 /DNA_END=1119 /DNA_ORIENTATION=+
MNAEKNNAVQRRIGVLAGHVGSEASGLQATICPTSGRSLFASTSAQSHAGVSGIVLSPVVARALDAGLPVVALESTIITHGMPYPQNLQTAKDVEAVVTQAGAVPATIAILDGVPHVGLDAAQLDRLAQEGHKVKKTSRRDLPHVMATGACGSTTVSCTMILAARCGIDVFVTGGIGGVHRGAENSMDISADLTELGRTPVAVVCAGAKSVLDIPRTLEYLETQGVPVATIGSDEFPAFFTPTSGCKSPSRVDTPEQAAAMIKASSMLNLGGGMVFAAPIPDKDRAGGSRVEAAITKALDEADKQRVMGAEVTPFLLKRVQELSGGESLTANIALIKNNAVVGSKIAAALSSW